MDMQTAILNSSFVVFIVEKIMDFIKSKGVKTEYLQIISWIIALGIIAVYNYMNYKTSIWASIAQAFGTGIVANKIHDFQTAIGMK